MRKVTTTVMMWDSSSTTDGMIPAKSGASTVDGRDGHIPMKGITIFLLIFGNMSTTLVCMVDITLGRMLVTKVCTFYIEVRRVAINYIHKVIL